MGFRFSRRIKIAPGITLNFSKSGVSTSIGGRGARVTIGRGKVRESLGFPGTGFGYTQTQTIRKHVGHDEHSAGPVEPLPKGKAWRGWLWIALFVATAIILARSLVR